MLDAVFVYAKPQFVSTGLSNNNRQCVRVLRKAGFGAETLTLDEVGDWTEFILKRRPRLIVFGALCIPPERLGELAAAHAETGFVVRIHSNLPWLFQATAEFPGAMAVLHLARERHNVFYSVVNPDEATRWQAAGLPVVALPNVYGGEIASTPRAFDGPHPYVHLSAIFALRVLKHPAGNVLAAATLNREVSVKLYVQTGRSDSPKYVQQICLLANACEMLMPCEPYRRHDQFIEWLGDTIDVGLQLSATESFNYVAMEHMALGIPVVASRAVGFCPWQVDYEDSRAAAQTAYNILGDYQTCSHMALAAARQVAAKNEEIFLENIRLLLDRKEF